MSANERNFQEADEMNREVGFRGSISYRIYRTFITRGLVQPDQSRVSK